MGLHNTVLAGFREPVRVFEQGRVFINDAEPEHLAALSYNGRDSRSPNSSRNEGFFDLKADVEAVIMSRGFVPMFTAGSENFLHSGQTANIIVNGAKIGWLGRIKPALEQELDVQGVYAFELDLAALTVPHKPEFTPASQFPAAFRDISLLVSIDKSNDDVMRDIRSSAGSELTLETLRLFDVYEGKGIPEGFRSLAYTLSYRAHNRTLTDAEVERVHTNLRDTLKAEGYILR